MEEPSSQNVPDDPLEEVKKLQELVRKLEQQNQQLRNKQNIEESEENNTTKSCKNDSNSVPTIHVPRTPLRPLDSKLNPNSVNVECDESRSSDSKCSGAEKREARKSGVLDDVDLINIEDLDVSDEDSWLYMSPKGLSTEERSVSPYKWLRKDVEDPQNRELQLARRALAYKLDESAILKSHHSSNSSSPFSMSLQGKPPPGRVIDSRTFTRGKKKRTPFEEGSKTLPVIESLKDEEQEEDEAQNDSGSYLTPLRSTEVIDVQEIARMQEESLRQSSPSTPKRISQSSNSDRRWSTSSKNSMSDNEDVFPSQHMVDGGIMPRPENATLSVHDPCSTYNSSAHSSPPDSFHGSNSSLDNGTGDSLRHSLPNLCKGYGGSRSLPRQQVGKLPAEINGSPGRTFASGTKLTSFARTSAIHGERRLGMPSRSASNLRSPSASHRVQRQMANGTISPPFLTPPALSPTTSRHPLPGLIPKPSGLPKLSRIPAPRARSGVPIVSRTGDNEAENELWSDGCY